MARRPLRVCYFGTYRDEYSRNRILIAGLRRAGVEVVECHVRLWRDIEDRVQAVQGGWKSAAFVWRVARAYLALLAAWWRIRGDYDVMVVGYPGQFDLYLARLLAWGRPLVWDVFMSIYLIATERGLGQRSPRTVAGLRTIEKWACRLPDRLVLDTDDYVEWFGQTYGVDRARFVLVPTGADSDVFRPAPTPRPWHHGVRIVYYGSYIANHGVPVIVAAAQRLAQQPEFRFELIGDGPDRSAAEQLAAAYGLTNVAFSGWLAQEELVRRVWDADICLGVFGVTPQSLMTVQNKIYEGLALAKPVITGDGPAVRRAFRHKEHLYLVPRADPDALAAAIVELAGNPDLAAQMAATGHAEFSRCYSVAALGERFKEFLMAELPAPVRAQVE
jgi:glycosyltransferase involved in cell wall biosynthesis